MREQGFGRIIMTTSAAGLYGNFGQSNYSSAKMGLIGFMNSLKIEGEKYNIKVNTIAPVAASRLTEDILPPDMLEKLDPEFVAPMTLYLSSDQCEENGMVFNAGAGYFNRAAVLTGHGKAIGDGTVAPTVEQVHAAWDEINDMTNAYELPNVMAFFDPMMKAFQPEKESASGEGAGGLTVSGVFAGLADTFQPEAAEGVDLVYQFDISGADAGSWHAVVKDKQCQVVEGSHDSPTTTLSMSDEDFLKMVSGDASPMSLFTSGKLKISGDVMKSQLFEKLFKLI
jgi:putative sterol carrier protein